jgi:hypothetical protein
MSFKTQKSFAVMCLLGLVNSTATPGYKRNDDETTTTFPLYYDGIATATSIADAQVFSTDIGGYACIRNGYIFAHSQLNSGDAVANDNNLLAFYGTTALNLGTDLTNY